MFLKKINNFLIFPILFFCFHLNASDVNNYNKEILIDYLSNINEFHSQFLQSDGITIEEGEIFIKNKRIRIDYIKPKKIRIVIASKKAMYFNIDLQEIEYFNPKNSSAQIFFDIFNSNIFLNDTMFFEKKNSLTITKEIKIDKDSFTDLIIIFEKGPLVIRKIKIKKNNSNDYLVYSIINPNFNFTFEKDFFSMANPMIK